MDTAGWSSLQDILLQQGQMKQRQDIGRAFTTKFLAGP
jgi:hypothetical protein